MNREATPEATPQTKPGFYVYTDALAPAQRTQLGQDGGELCALFVDENEGPRLIPVAGMAGTFTQG
jgi:hypothetical protein